jgi:hypothetical protein
LPPRVLQALPRAVSAPSPAAALTPACRLAREAQLCQELAARHRSSEAHAIAGVQLRILRAADVLEAKEQENLVLNLK